MGSQSWKSTFPYYTNIHLHAHTLRSIQVLLMGSAPLQRGDKRLEEGKKNNQKKERTQNDGELKERCFGGVRDHTRQLAEIGILQVFIHTQMHHTHTPCSYF